MLMPQKVRTPKIPYHHREIVCATANQDVEHVELLLHGVGASAPQRRAGPEIHLEYVMQIEARFGRIFWDGPGLLELEDEPGPQRFGSPAGTAGAAARAPTTLRRGQSGPVGASTAGPGPPAWEQVEGQHIGKQTSSFKLIKPIGQSRRRESVSDYNIRLQFMPFIIVDTNTNYCRSVSIWSEPVALK